MAFTGITATEAEINQKLGDDFDTGYTDTMKTQALLQSESFLNNLTGFNWSDWYATTPNVDVKYMVTEFTASLVAIEGLKHKMSGTTGNKSRVETEDQINILAWRIRELTKVFKEIGTQKFMEDA